MSKILFCILRAAIFSGISICISSLLYEKLHLFRRVRYRKVKKIELIKAKVKTIVIMPVIEEIFFRYQIYMIVSMFGMRMEVNNIIFLVVSSLLFTFSHMPKDILHFIEKVCVGGLLYSVIYLLYENLLLMILIHIFHNFYVLLIQEYEKEGEVNG